jgi:uncharacterized protein (DUF924 family)
MNKAFLGVTTLLAVATPIVHSQAVELSPSIHFVSGSRPAPIEAQEVVKFWEDAGPALWFAKDESFDRRFRERFLRLHEAAARGELEHWSHSAHGALALIILLDQFPRNAFRNTPRMYATDVVARAVADAAIKAGHDRVVPNVLQLFVYLPFGHSENLADKNDPFSWRALWGSRT